MNAIMNAPVSSFIVSTEPARVQAKAEFDLEIQNINLAEFKLKEGLKTKVDKSRTSSLNNGI